MLRWWIFCVIAPLLWDSSKGTANVGCLFSENVCESSTEWCFDDYAFGHCLPLYGTLEDEDLYRYSLTKSDLHALEREMERLLALGYRWSHAYTQCTLQEHLVSFRNGESDVDIESCSPFADADLEAALQAIEGSDKMQIDPRDLAYVRFTPSASDPHAEFADEVYMPNPVSEEASEAKHNLEDEGPEDEEDDFLRYLTPPYGDYDISNPISKKSIMDTSRLADDQTVEDDESEMLLSALTKFVQDMPDDSPTRIFSRHYNTPDSFREGDDDPLNEDLTQLTESFGYTGKKFGDNYPAPNEDEDEISEEDLIRYARLLYEAKQKEAASAKFFKPENDIFEDQSISPLYTEGGLVFLKSPSNLRDERPPYIVDPVEDNNLPFISLEPRDEWAGFKRRERLDVKKPGPFYRVNNFAFDYMDSDDNGEIIPYDVQQDSPSSFLNSETPHPRFPRPGEFRFPAGEMETPMEDGSTDEQNTVDDEQNRTEPKATEAVSREVSSEASDMKSKKQHSRSSRVKTFDVMPETSEEDEEDVDLVDTSYAYVGVKDSFRSWKEGADIPKLTAELLHLPREEFSNIRVDKNQVTFKVLPNSQELNASEVARRIEENKDIIKKELGVDVTTAGIGNRVQLPAALSLNTGSTQSLQLITFLLCGVFAAGLIAAAALYVVKRHARSRQKLQNLTQPDTEASKDYQELCRARMASKPQEKPEPIHASQRIASLSRESEGSNNSPSSRSSTSSWSEEPVLTNMDISTGHMVLSYMEDHLKNKDRLEQEWIALCAYEAEPCASAQAEKPENVNKNRYPEAIPYDHSRVVLNDLANASGSDYINASTITDHDPRNPAYIASQGPLPHTAADFWQMVWEQGSVVIVMLTRLTETGQAMCHRYWPEEGSEVYHIYEVHLVSEHIWCDDYLVRSFYLKNLKTGETRTVTQFHFLSWPDNAVPLSTKALLEFRRKVNKSYRGRSCPIVVHCSDGVGRAGTYTLIDMVLNRMAKGAKEIDIAATLEHIRDQRPGMVKTRQQFEFVLMAVAEEVHAILKALPQ